MACPWHFLDISFTLPWHFLHTSLKFPLHFLDISFAFPFFFVHISLTFPLHLQATSFWEKAESEVGEKHLPSFEVPAFTSLPKVRKQLRPCFLYALSGLCPWYACVLFDGLSVLYLNISVLYLCSFSALSVHGTHDLQSIDQSISQQSICYSINHSFHPSINQLIN